MEETYGNLPSGVEIIGEAYETSPEIFASYRAGMEELRTHYPQASLMLSLLEQRLSKNLGYSRKPGRSPNREDIVYADKSTKSDDQFPLWLAFDLLLSLPSDEVLYNTLRPWFFHPNADVRNCLFKAVLRFRDYFPPECMADLGGVIKNDPLDLIGYWLEEYERCSGPNLLERHLGNLIPKRPEVRFDIDLERVRAYFNLGRYASSPYPVEIAEEERSQFIATRLTTSILDAVGLVNKLGSGANPNLADKRKLHDLQREFADLSQLESGHFGPDFLTMIGQLSRLTEAEITQAISEGISRPHVFSQHINDSHFQDDKSHQIIGSLVLCTSYLRTQENIQNILFVVMQWPQLITSPKIFKALSRVAYLLPIEILDKELLPMALSLDSTDSANREVLRQLLYSCEVAMLRDLSGHIIPRFGTRDPNIF